MICTACGRLIGDEAWAAYREDAGFVPDLESVMRKPLINMDVHEECRAGWSVPDGYSLAWEMPSVRDRERRCYREARRQSLSLNRERDGWSIDDLNPASNLVGTILSGDRLRLPDGREVPRIMSLGDVEAFLGIDYTEP